MSESYQPSKEELKRAEDEMTPEYVALSAQRESEQEQHSKPSDETKENTFENEFSDIEMKVELTNICTTGNCKFCSPMFRPTVLEANTNSFLKIFENNLETYLKRGGKKVILTGGGEPTDAPAKLFGALEIINAKTKKLNISLNLLTVYSNGVNLLKHISEKEGSQTTLDKLVELGVKDVNLSISGLTKKERTDVSGEEMGNIDFDTLIPEIVGKGIRVMTRSTLADGYIDSIGKIEEFTEWMSRLGVKIVYFSDLFDVPVRNKHTTPGSHKVLKWTDDHRINFSDLLNKVKESKDFKFIHSSTRHNNQGNTFEFKHISGVKVLFGDLIIGNESDKKSTYCYVKPDGSMEAHNNARDDTNRAYVPLSQIKKYRPGRDDL